MWNILFESIRKADIEKLIADKASEQKTIEYKRSLPTNSDADKAEFARDVASFANTAGGDILFGVSDLRDDQGHATGTPEEALGIETSNIEMEKRRLEDILRNGISPRISGIQIRNVDGFPNGPVIVVRIPRSWHGPHMVTLTKPSFFARGTNGKFALDPEQIRRAFAGSEDLSARMTAFRNNRIGKVLAGETPVPLAPNPKVVLHVLPVAQFDSMFRPDLNRVFYENWQKLMPLSMSSTSVRHNLDGVLVSTTNGQSGGLWGYTQAYREGGIESVDAYVLADDDGSKAVASMVLEEKVMSATSRYLTLQRALGIDSPILVQLSLIGIRGYRVAASGRYWTNTAGFDRDVVVLPGSLVEGDSWAIGDVVRPIFDVMWQAAGWDRDHNFDATGKWVG